MKMEQGYKNEVEKCMENYNFDSKIKVSYIFENFESDEDQSQPFLPPELPEQFVTQNNYNATSLTSFSETIPCFEDIDNRYNIMYEKTNESVLSTLLRNRHNKNEPDPIKIQPKIQPKITRNDGKKQNKTKATRRSNNPASSKYTKRRIPSINESQKASTISSNNSNVADLLDAVSLNLIRITKWYHYYISKYRENTANLKTAMNNFHRYKTYFFSISFSASASLIVPNERNKMFIENFITRTIEIANRKGWFWLSVKELRHLIAEMIQFTKQTVQASKNKHFAQSTVSRQSNNIAKENLSHSTPTQGQDSVCLYSIGPSGSEVIISIDKEILRNNSEIIRPNVDTERNHDVNYCSKRQKTNYSYNSSEMYRCTENLQSQDHNQNIPAQQALPGYRIETFSTSNSIRDESRSDQNDYENNEIRAPVARSVSRDSGFFSPVLNTSDQTFNSHSAEEQNSIPKNPAAPFVYQGSCKTCGRLTRDVCLGCNKTYYCSHMCQRIDWIEHKIICIQNQGKI